MLTAQQAKQIAENSYFTNWSISELKTLADTLRVIKLKALAGETSYSIILKYTCGMIPEGLQKLGYDVDIKSEVVDKTPGLYGLGHDFDLIECTPYNVYNITISWG